MDTGSALDSLGMLDAAANLPEQMAEAASMPRLSRADPVSMAVTARTWA